MVSGGCRSLKQRDWNDGTTAAVRLRHGALTVDAMADRQTADWSADEGKRQRRDEMEAMGAGGYMGW